MLAGIMAIVPAWPASYYTVPMDDPKAVYLTRENFSVHGDGSPMTRMPSSRQ